MKIKTTIVVGVYRYKWKGRSHILGSLCVLNHFLDKPIGN